MKAMVYHNYGSPNVLRMEEVEKPVPGDDQVLIKVYATSVNAGDWHLLRADPFLFRLYSGLTKPRHTILGADVAGRVEAVGKNVRQFEPGDEVFGDLAAEGRGAFAEYVCANEEALVLKPSRLAFEQAAAVPTAAVTALQGLRDPGRIQPGQKVLINGASGGVGTFAVQLAKSFGARVTAVCSTPNVDLIRSIGADQVIDYTQDDFSENGEHYDLIVGANGYHPISEYMRALSSSGIYVMIGGSTAQMWEAMLLGPVISRKGRKIAGNLQARPNQKDLSFIKELLESGKVVPVIDRCYPLEHAPDALRYVEGGHARGKVVITV